MELSDGLTRYKSGTEFYERAVELESQAQQVLSWLRQHKDSPTPDALSETKRFLIEVEKWKAGCLQQRMGNAAKNSERVIWEAFRGAVNAGTAIEAITAIMQLKGFGSSVDEESGQRRAKVATSVLRFLWPNKWGVVDWRVAAILGLLEKQNWDIDKTLSKAKGQKAEELRNLYYIIDEMGACEINRQYREISQKYQGQLSRAADVDMALFGLSLVAWPMPS